MDHKSMKEQIFALYDGELSAAARKEVEAHIALCGECRELYEGWAKTAKAFFKKAPEPASSEFFVRQVMNRVHELEAPKPARDWGLSLRWLVPAAGLALMFLAVMPITPQVVPMDAMLFQDTNGAPSWEFSNVSEQIQ